MNVEISARKVDCLVRHDVPQEDDNIISDFDMREEDISQIEGLEVYRRDKRDCPFGSGNWMIDIYLKDGNIFCVKLPIEMSMDQVKRFCSPLMEKIEGGI